MAFGCSATGLLVWGLVVLSAMGRVVKVPPGSALVVLVAAVVAGEVAEELAMEVAAVVAEEVALELG